MQCDDCKHIYRTNDIKQPCPKCGGKGTVLVDVTRECYPNRAARRKGGKVEKYLPCPDCSKAEAQHEQNL